MSKQLITLQVAGKQVTCNFGINYFYKFVYDITGRDMLSGNIDGLGSALGFELLADLVYAGYKANNTVSGTKEDVTHEEITRHFLSMSPAEFTAALTDAIKAMNPEAATGEAETQAAESA